MKSNILGFGLRKVTLLARQIGMGPVEFHIFTYPARAGEDTFQLKMVLDRDREK
jgi:hypothetical protein